jgi:tRNA-dihydrouridine synthase B
LLREPDLVVSLSRAVVEATPLPVTVKTRLGWDHGSIVIVDLARRLEDAGVRALTLHARTRCQMFKGDADWDWIATVKRAVSIPVIGNGDVGSPEDVLRMFAHTGCDAVMVGRGAIGNPWLFSRARSLLDRGFDPGPPSFEQRIAGYLEILDESIGEKGEARAVREMRKHLASSLRGMPGIAWLRGRLMEEIDRDGVGRAVAAYLERLHERSPARPEPEAVFR